MASLNLRSVLERSSVKVNVRLSIVSALLSFSISVLKNGEHAASLIKECDGQGTDFLSDGHKKW